MSCSRKSFGVFRKSEGTGQAFDSKALTVCLCGWTWLGSLPRKDDPGLLS
jgi:hypothetical protein